MEFLTFSFSSAIISQLFSSSTISLIYYWDYMSRSYVYEIFRKSRTLLIVWSLIDILSYIYFSCLHLQSLANSNGNTIPEHSQSNQDIKRGGTYLVHNSAPVSAISTKLRMVQEVGEIMGAQNLHKSHDQQLYTIWR